MPANGIWDLIRRLKFNRRFSLVIFEEVAANVFTVRRSVHDLHLYLIFPDVLSKVELLSGYGWGSSNII